MGTFDWSGSFVTSKDANKAIRQTFLGYASLLRSDADVRAIQEKNELEYLASRHSSGEGDRASFDKEKMEELLEKVKSDKSCNIVCAEPQFKVRPATLWDALKILIVTLQPSLSFGWLEYPLYILEVEPFEKED